MRLRSAWMLNKKKLYSSRWRYPMWKQSRWKVKQLNRVRWTFYSSWNNKLGFRRRCAQRTMNCRATRSNRRSFRLLRMLMWPMARNYYPRSIQLTTKCKYLPMKLPNSHPTSKAKKSPKKSTTTKRRTKWFPSTWRTSCRKLTSWKPAQKTSEKFKDNWHS